jgi:hypothetical protein
MFSMSKRSQAASSWQMQSGSLRLKAKSSHVLSTQREQSMSESHPTAQARRIVARPPTNIVFGEVLREAYKPLAACRTAFLNPFLVERAGLTLHL